MLKNKRFKWGAILVIGALLLGIAGTVLPASADVEPIEGSKASSRPHRGGAGAGAGLDQALENGDITQAEYDAMKAI